MEIRSSDGLTIDEACKFLWEEVRCPLFHRYSLRNNSNQEDPSGMIKSGRVLATDDEKITQLEQQTSQRPYSYPTFIRQWYCKSSFCTIFWV